MSRGLIYSIFAKFSFIFGGYVIHIYLARKFGTDLYGTYGVLLSILTISYIFLDNSIRPTVSKLIALHPGSAKKVFTKGLFLQFILALTISLIIFSFASTLSKLFKDTNLLKLLRICGVVILVQSLFFIYCGALSGLKRFFAENCLVSIYSIVRPVAVIFLISLGFGVSGAMYGFLLASTLATIVGIRMMAGVANEPRNLKAKDIWSPSISNIVIFGSVTVLLNIDLLFVKHFMAGMDSAGLYTAAAAFSKTPYWFLLSFGTIALPLVASSFGKGDLPQCRIYLSQVLRYSTLIFLPLIVIMAATSTDLIVFFYKSEYEFAGFPLRILIFGIWFVGLISIIAYIMIAIGRERLMAFMSLCTIVLDVILNIFLVPRFGLIGAAVATSLSALILLLVSGWYVINRIGIDITPMTFCRIVILSFILYYITKISIFDNMPLFIEYAILYVGFALALIITREIDSDDWLVIKRLVQSKT